MLRRIEEGIVTVVILPDRTGSKTDSRGSAFCLTGMISGLALVMVLRVLLSAKARRCFEKSESESKDD